MTHFHNRMNAVKTLHYRRGIGDIQEIRMFADGRIELDAKGYKMRPHTRRGRISAPGKPGGFEIRMYGTRFRFVEI